MFRRRATPPGEDWRWQLEKAEAFLGAAQFAFERGQWETCVSRAYYAIYHLVVAVLAAKAGKRRNRWDHKPLLRAFKQEFTSKGFLFDRGDANSLDDLLQERFAADYDNVNYDARLTRRALEKALALAQKLRGALE